MPNLILEVDKSKAIVELEKMYVQIEMSLNRMGYFMKLQSEPLDCYDTLLGAVNVKPDGRTIIPIWDGASGYTTYSSPEANYRLRFWHDYLHLQYCLRFTYEDEALVVKYHMDLAKHYNISALATEILHIELAGQLRYHELQGDFPYNQKAFVDSCLSHGVQRASTFKH